MKRYQELTAAVAVVIGSMDAVMSAERLSPAWYKLLRVKVYLDKQAAHDMEGRTEDGAEPKIVCEYACMDCSAALESGIRCVECAIVASNKAYDAERRQRWQNEVCGVSR